MSTDPATLLAEDHFAKGFPWCDTCRQPAVWSEFFGNRHVTPEHPNGVPQRRDESGHEVTMRGWWKDEPR